MTHIRVSDDVREKLNLLKSVMLKQNVNDVIIQLMLIREYDEAFFDRMREKQGMI